MDGGEAPPEGIPIGGDEASNALRFEDLTIDDDLPLLDRVVRYCRSGIALQRLVHVKMLAETAETVGTTATIQTLIPLLNPLVSDPESIIRQHLASQLLPLSITCMLGQPAGTTKPKVNDLLDNPSLPRSYNERGYKVVTSTLITHLNTLIMDADVDVRRSASEALAGFALQIRPEDVASIVLPIPMRMAHHANKQSASNGKPTSDNFQEEIRVTASNLLAELAGATETGQIPADLVIQYLMPSVMSLVDDKSFRVRRSAAQALPRVLGGSTLVAARERILPAFTKLSKDDMYRVRKSTGECLVDMSRSLMLIAAREESNEVKKSIRIMRRKSLIPIAVQHLADTNKFVRHGMMQFLGPFIASFYPLDDGDSALNSILPGAPDSPLTPDSTAGGIGAQFFPHASSMVSRLNSSATSTSSTPTPTPASLDQTSPELSEMEELHQMLPQYLQSNRISILSLRAIVSHRTNSPPEYADLEAVLKNLLSHFVGLAKARTGDDNTDAEMRVYCAYSFPAVVLLLGPENWGGMLKDCFMTLVNPSYGSQEDEEASSLPPLPVKRCLASSLHTVAHILGPELALSDIMPVFREYFFRDPDDSVRLNVIRNFPWLLSLLPPEPRDEYLAMWSQAVKGEDVLLAYKRSATNPMLLNWRQRDYVSRSMPDIIGLVDFVEVQETLWPVIQMLLTDSVSLVREDAVWCIPLLLNVYCAENLASIADGSKESHRHWSADVCKDVINWLKENILGGQTPGPNGNGKSNFGKRQLYCRICASVGLALRFADIASQASKGEVSSLDEKFQAMLRLDGRVSEAPGGIDTRGPYQALTHAERKHLRRLLVFDLLPPALEMKDDRVTNVRLTLMKVLKAMPEDVRTMPSVSEVLQELEVEVETWESFNAGDKNEPIMTASSSGASGIVTKSSSTAASSTASRNSNTSSRSGPVSVDDDYPMGEDPIVNNNNNAQQPPKQKRGSNLERRNSNGEKPRIRKGENRNNGNVSMESGGKMSMASV